MIPGSANPLLLASAAAGGYKISKSVRFNSADSAYLSRTPGSAGNRKTWTWAGWVKRSKLGAFKSIFGSYDGSTGSTYFSLIFTPSDTIRVEDISVNYRETAQVFRDVSAWYHVVLSVDTTNGTADDRIKLYVNGSQVTAFNTTNNPSPSADLGINGTHQHGIGRPGAQNAYYQDSYLADVHLVDGQALDPTSFGEFDDNGIWQPIQFTPQATPNNGTTWSSYGSLSASPPTLSGTIADIFDGSIVQAGGSFSINQANAGVTITFSPALPAGTTVKLLGDVYGTAGSNDYLQVNGTGYAQSLPASAGTTTFAALSVPAGASGISSIYLYREGTSTFNYALMGIEVDGVLLIDGDTSNIGVNGFHLPFDDNSSAAALGTDTSGNGNDWTVNNIQAVTGGPTSVAAATGALPIYNTTDTYGTVKGTGTRTDSNSGSIVLAIPMDGANNGTTFTDESATIKGSGSAKSITVNGDAKTVTSVSKFYGSSGAYDGTGDYLSLASSSDFQLWNSTAWTVECFIYINSLASSFYFFGVGNRASTTTRCMLSVNTSGNVVIDWDGTSADTTVTFTTGLATGRWYHIAAASNGTTLKVYVDGIAASQTATLGTSTQANAPVSIAVPGLASNPATYNGLNGYLQDFRIYKGVAKYTANFNPPSATQNATVAAGNDSLVDTPTSYGVDAGNGGEVRGNYATLNPLNNAGAAGTYSNGNLEITTGSSQYGAYVSTIATPTSGKWYAEAYITSGANTRFGFVKASYTPNSTEQLGNVAGTMAYRCDVGDFRVALTTKFTGGATCTSGDTVGLALDNDNGEVKIYKNGTLQGTATGIEAANWCFAGSDDNGAGTASHIWNFGQRPFAYTAPSGYKALCTANLPDPVVAKPSEVMDVQLWTGNGSAGRAITGYGFSPDLVWIKSRSAAYSHALFDTVRGVQLGLQSNATSAEISDSDALTAFNSNGFTVGTGNTIFGVNTSSQTFVGWCWDAGSSTVTLNPGDPGAGSITSQVRANASAGFSVVTYTVGNNTSQTIGHGLGVAPQLIIVKERNQANNWQVYHASLGNGSFLYLNGTNASASNNLWNNTSPTSTVFSIRSGGSANFYDGKDHVAYCWAPLVGYSSFGSYTGNGSTDGPFVYTGFRPRYLLIKASSAVGTWIVRDTERDQYNSGTSAKLAPNYNYEENNSSFIGLPSQTLADFVSNGFKVRSTGGISNDSGVTYIYAAFAESPQKFSRAR